MEATRKTRKPRPAPRSDLTFGWAAPHVRLSAWREYLGAWAVQHSGRGAALEFGNAWLDYLVAHPAIATQPEEFCRTGATAVAAPLLEWLRLTNASESHRRHCRSAARSFFEWVLDQRLSALDDDGRRTFTADFRNPVPHVRGTAGPSETARCALPTRFLRELLDVLTGDDWAWARQQAEDQVRVVDPATGEWRSEWCPIRAAVLALKLLLPLRTHQVRFLESSEGDDVIFRDGQWTANPAPTRPRRGRVRRGFLHCLEDAMTGEAGVGFFVNTNKTADFQQRAHEQGYVIPWENKRAIAVAELLESWQARYNPVLEPMPWSCLHDRKLALTAPRSGSAFFLMRDPCAFTHRNEPITKGRVEVLWHRLVVELEGRLAARGEAAANGEPLCFTRPGPGTVRYSRYDLHTLRVSLITALAVDGALPLHILSKAVAGHASVVMTCYYVKVGREAMREQFDAAEARIDQVEQQRFAQFLQSQGCADGAVVTNDPAALEAVEQGDAAAWLMLDTGLCPVGATRCHDGGPPIKKGLHGPVPGGARNCCRCRFHLTGPAFLGGLVAKFNAKSFERNGAERECEAAQAALRQAENDRVAVETGGGAFDVRCIDRERIQLDLAERRLESVKATMAAIAILAQRTREAMEKTSGGLSLVGVGQSADVHLALTATSDIDLADRVCQAADIYPAPEASEASLQRSRAIDRLALRQGHVPIMLQLSEQEALRMGNEMTRLMSRQMGRDNSMDILSGHRLPEPPESALLAALLCTTPVPSTALCRPDLPAIEHEP